MRHSFRIIGVFSTLILLGAGCAASSVRGKPPVSVPAPVPAKSAEIPSTATTTAIDATWKTFTNKALNFSFQWPAKGRYAPTWEVTFIQDGDASIVNGCHAQPYTESQPPASLAAGDQTFCHTSYSDGAAGTIHLFDDYAAKIGMRYVVVHFVKAYSTVAGPVFDQATYRAMLDQIVGTFRMAE